MVMSKKRQLASACPELFCMETYGYQESAVFFFQLR
jgi:hypothetical protein